MPLRKLTGVILRRRDLGEFDRLLTIFTAEEGMIEALAKGVRKIQSKLGSKLDLFNLLQLQVAQTRGKWPTIIGVDVEINQLKSDVDFAQFTLLCALAEISYFGQREQGEDAFGFKLFREALAAIKDTADQNVLLAYSIKLLARLGYLASPLQCAHCAAQKANYYRQTGMLLCQACGGREAMISKEAVTMLAQLLADELTKIKLAQFNLLTKAEVAAIIQDLSEYHFEQKLKAWSLLRYNEILKTTV